MGSEDRLWTTLLSLKPPSATPAPAALPAATLSAAAKTIAPAATQAVAASTAAVTAAAEYTISAMQLKKFQALTGLPFGVFLAAHLVSHWAFLKNLDFHSDVLFKLRRLYLRVEPIFVGAWLLHGLAALEVFRRRDLEDYKKVFAAAQVSTTGLLNLLMRTSGAVLMALVGGHFYAVRVHRPAVVGPMEYAAFAAEFFPEFFIPYYLTLAASGTTHLTIGLARAMAVLGVFELDQEVLLPVLAVLNFITAAATLKLALKYPVQSQLSQDLIIKANKEMYPEWLWDVLYVRWKRQNAQREE